MLIDAILRNGSSAAPEANRVPPPTGWRDEDIKHNEASNAGGDDKKSYTEEQQQSVLRCAGILVLCFFTLCEKAILHFVFACAVDITVYVQ